MAPNRTPMAMSKGGAVEFYGATVDKPIRLTASSAANAADFAVRNGYGDTTFAAPIYQTGERFAINQEGGSTATFSGGGNFAGPVEFYPKSTAVRTVVVEGKPVVQPHPGTSDYGFKFCGKTELHLKCPGNRMYIGLGAETQGGGSALHCWTNDVLNYQCDIVLGYGSTMDLHGFDQQVGDLTAGVAGRVRSDEPATILAYYDNALTWGANAGIDGAVTFRKSGPKQLTLNGTNTTSGALVAFAGPLVIGSTGC